MSQSETPAFAVECPECGWNAETDDLQRAGEFEEKHEKHTGHQIEWVRSEIDINIESPTNWHLACETCGKSWEFPTEEAAIEFQEDHKQYTDHKILNEPVEQAIELPDSDSIARIMRDLEVAYESGVPTETLVYVLTEQGFEPASVVAEIENLKKQGEVYEPTSDKLRTT